MSEQTRDCKCGKKMVLENTGMRLDTSGSLPTLHSWLQCWRCSYCGAVEDAPSVVQKEDYEVRVEEFYEEAKL